MEILRYPFRRIREIFGDRNVFSQAEQEELLKKYSKEDQEKLFSQTFVSKIFNSSGWTFCKFFISYILLLFICLQEKILHQLKYKSTI